MKCLPCARKAMSGQAVEPCATCERLSLTPREKFQKEAQERVRARSRFAPKPDDLRGLETKTRLE